MKEPSPTATRAHATPRTECAVEIESLRMTGRGFALDVANLNLPARGCTAIVGPNGAGKSSLLESLLGVRQAEVTGSVYGHPWESFAKLSARREAGVQLQNFRYPAALQVRDLVRLHRLLYSACDDTVAALLDIHTLSSRYYSQLSRGEKQRVDLYMAFAHRPRLLLLDEPAAGLDSHFLSRFCSLVRSRTDCATIMVCHSAEELALAQNLVWVRDGRIEGTGAPDAMRRDLTGDWVLEVTFSNAATARSTAESASVLPGVLSASLDATGMTLHAAGGDALAAHGAALVRHPQVISCRLAATTLTELLRHCAGGFRHD